MPNHFDDMGTSAEILVNLWCCTSFVYHTYISLYLIAMIYTKYNATLFSTLRLNASRKNKKYGDYIGIRNVTLPTDSERRENFETLIPLR